LKSGWEVGFVVLASRKGDLHTVGQKQRNAAKLPRSSIVGFKTAVPPLEISIGGIVRAEKGVMYDIAGVEDHIHMYLRWRPDATISDLMRTVKARSSKWIHESYPNLAAFAWQEGYSVFSVGKSQEGAVKAYIAGQAEPQKKEDFKSELLRILLAHGVEFDEKYVLN